jgi:hypothetical protein
MIFLTTQPLWLTGILFGLIILSAMAGPVMVRRCVSLEKLRTNNEVAGFKFATVGVLYAVLLAFAVVVVWEKFSLAEADVAQEAGAAATIYSLSEGIGSDPGAALRGAVTNYLEAAINEDWPDMERGRANPNVTLMLKDVYHTLLGYHPDDPRGTALLTEILHQMDVVSEARHARLVMASGIMPGIVWLVLLLGAIVTVGFTFFFGTENLRAQVMMTGGLSSLIFSGLLIIVAIDHPFAGSVKVSSEALYATLKEFDGGSSPLALQQLQWTHSSGRSGSLVGSIPGHTIRSPD